jgi:RsiW-degrading membrane proteinase PrsW (M82 family)
MVPETRQTDRAFHQPDPERIARERRGLWIACTLEVAGLLVFVAIFNFIVPGWGNRLTGASLIFLGLLMSLIPAALWLLFFYQQDRLEPEPKQKIVNVFVLGGLVTAAVAQPLLSGAFAVNEWLYSSWIVQLLGGILLVGVVQELVVYLVVRYSVYGDPEFDERVDGVIYATAAGLGVATVLNFEYVIAHGGVDLGIGSMRMVVNALAHGSFAGVLGYFMGQARFEKTPAYYLPAGFGLAATLNGLFFFVEDRVAGNGFVVNTWNSLLFATVVAGLTLAAVFWLINRANEETMRLALAPAGMGGMSPVATGPVAELTTPEPGEGSVRSDVEPFESTLPDETGGDQ